MASLTIGRVLSFAQDNANVKEVSNLVNVPYDYVSLSYTGTDVTTAVFKLGGPSGSVQATLTLTYSSPGVLSSVQRS
jgi:hypothetical protein